MARPALIVGLGGTGQWVLTWLKRDLKLSNNGEMPRNVRLLSIDTSTQLEAGVRMVGGRQEEAVRIGSVGLGSDEFIYVGGDSLPVAERVKQGRLPQIGRWYHAQRWLDTLPPAVFILDDGAGRIRQFGRVAVFKDVLGQEAGSKIWRALRTAIEAVRTQVDQQRRLEIIVVGSFAGGTGSGMFIDIALILRLLAQQMHVHHVLRGFFALPSVFTPDPDDEMKARTLAAWRELNRFMVVNSDFPMPLVEYVENNPTFRIRPTQRIFDACYLVDSKRDGHPIAAEAKYGVHPMVAEVISAILDEYAGTAYTQWVFTNLAPEYSRTPESPLYSAVGAYTVQVPAYYRQAVSSHKFADQVLQKLLKPKQGGLAVQGARRHLEMAAPDQNSEVGVGFAGRTKCRELLSTESVTYGSETAKPTLFTARIAALNNDAYDQGKMANVVNSLARSGGAQASGATTSWSWTGYFTNLGDDPQFAQLRRNVLEEVNYNLANQYRRSDKKETADEVRNKMQAIPEDVRKRYGGLTADGRETYGAFGDRLGDCQDFHMVLFQRLTRLRLLDILMGRSDQDPVKSKSGKLGYAWDYFDGLADEFQRFLVLMDNVKTERERIKSEVKLQGLAQNAQNYMMQTTGKTFIIFWESPKVKQSEEAYLQAQQRLVDLRKEDILHRFVVETAVKMKAVCIEVRDTIQRWIWHLATGDDVGQLPGLWSILKLAEKNVADDHAYDTAVPAVQHFVAEQPPEPLTEDIAEALKQWEWLADFVGEPAQFVLKARINPEAEGQEPLLLGDPSSQVTPELRREVGQQNFANLVSLARRRYVGMAARTTVAEVIKATYPNDPKGFATEVATGAEPLFDRDLEGSPRRKTNLIRVQAQATDAFFIGSRGLEGELRGNQQLDRERPDDVYRIQVVNSENPFKLTLVRTDDLYTHDAFKAWGECMKAYQAHMNAEGQPQDPVLMHNFSAEVQAVVYERAIFGTGESYRPLHPRVVMLMENPRGIRQFLYLGMLGLITEREDRQVFRWELSWTRAGRAQTVWLTRGWNSETDKKDRPVRPDILNAIHGYAIMGKTWQPNREDKVDYDFADSLIKAEQKRIGGAEETRMIQENLETGFVAYLRNMAFDPENGDEVLRQDLADLATVATMMFQERLADLEEAERPKGSGPFKVYQPTPASSVQPDASQSSTAPPTYDEGDVTRDETTGSTFSPFGTGG